MAFVTSTSASDIPTVLVIVGRLSDMAIKANPPKKVPYWHSHFGHAFPPYTDTSVRLTAIIVQMMEERMKVL